MSVVRMAPYSESIRTPAKYVGQSQQRQSDPDKGALWYGMMAEGSRVFVPSIGTSVPHVWRPFPDSDDGLYALDAFTGKQLWAARVA